MVSGREAGRSLIGAQSALNRRTALSPVTRVLGPPDPADLMLDMSTPKGGSQRALGWSIPWRRAASAS